MISVIVPIYNVEKYLTKCLDSILASTYKDLEIILVDDGSTDNCSQICDEYLKKDRRIKVIHQQNGGLSDARNKGIDIARGDYISFIDSDDYIDKDLYSNVMDTFNSNDNIDIVVFGRYVEYKNKTHIVVPDVNHPITGKEALIDLASFKGFDMAAWDKVYKRDIIADLRYPFGKKNEDYYLTYKLLDNSKMVMFIQKPFYHYVQRQNSISRNKKISFDAVDGSLEEVEYVKKKYPNLLNVALTNYFFSYVSIYNVVIKQNIKIEYNQKKAIKRNCQKLLKSVLKNEYLGINKKGQAILFATSLFFYKQIYIIKSRKDF